MGKIVQSSPGANYLSHKIEIDEAIHRVLDSCWYILGSEVSAFEQEFSAFIGSKFGIGVANGTDAITIALRACGIGKGDEVITVSHTAVATVVGIELAGAIPVLIDIEPKSFVMNPMLIEAAITPKTRAIIPVHLYGHPVDMEAVMSIAKKYSLRVVEDCAQAHGAKYFKKRIGSFGDAAAFSFYPTKNLGALGDGGIVVTSDREIYDRARSEREYGWKERYISETVGRNSRLDELQAAVLRVKLKYLDQDNDKRKKIADLYSTALNNLDIILPSQAQGYDHVWHQFVITAPDREALRKRLQEKEIGTLVHYPVPIHLQPAYMNKTHIARNMSCTEKVKNQIVSLPIYPELGENDVQFVNSEITDWYRNR